MMTLDLDYSYRDESREAERRQLREAAKKLLCPRCPKLEWCSPHEVCVDVKTMENALAAASMFPLSHPSAPEGPRRMPGF